ncbi:lipid droplet assembly factor 1-like isoform X4 [Oncorhynchus clarkii lewisi]|uniref:lipid droplet assembly factor 1-like isoform X4 n=1 Tax=Oncorhynchus clarkii lewisi TaxID=490388 RepID=UPI0039B850FC
MQCNNVTTIPKGLLQLRDSLSSMMDSLYKDPKVAALMNTSMGQYLNGHPFLALAVLVFGSMATVPIGIFLTFATVTFIGATVGFVLLEEMKKPMGREAGGLRSCSVSDGDGLLQTQSYTDHCTAVLSLADRGSSRLKN